MTDGRTAGRAREAAVGDERDILVELHTGQGRGRVEHLTHARAALGAFIADDDHIALVDLTRVDGLDGRILGVEHARRAGVHHHFGRNCRALDDTAVLGNVAPQDGDAAGLRIRMLERTDDLGILIDDALKVLPNRLAGRRDERQIEQVALGQLLHDGRHTACHIEFRNVVRASRRQVTDIGHLGRQFVEQFEVKRDPCLVRDGQQVQDGVGRAANGHLAGQRIAERLGRQDIARLDILFEQLHDLHAGMLGQVDAGGVHGGDSAVAGQGHADGLGQAVHGVCRVHARTRAAARARAALALLELLLGHKAGLVRADRLKGFGQRDLLAVKVAGQHGAARNQDRWDVQAGRRHEHTGHDLVAVRNEHQGVELMGLRQGLDRVRNELAGRQRILHANMAHRDAVAHANGRHDDRGAARHGDAGLDSRRDLVQVDVARDDLGVGRDDADDRALHLLIGQTAGAQQRTVWHARRARGDIVASLRQRGFLLYDRINRKRGRAAPPSVPVHHAV